MRKIIAIGGGSIGFGSVRPEVIPISREIIKLSGKSKPRLLFIPTASLDEEAYVRMVKNHFGHQLGCQVDVLYLMRKIPVPSEIRRKIRWADILYVGGGNTLLMLHRWKRLGVDKLLRTAHREGKVLCGTSAGAICWFRQGNSDSRKYKDPKAKLIKVTGLGFLEALACPHYNAEKDREPELRAMMKKGTPGIAVALDNCAALEVLGDRYRALSSKRDAGVYKVFWRGGKYFKEPVPLDGKWRSLSEWLLKGRS